MLSNDEDTMHSHKLLFYFGGFSPVGGIETFCKTLLCYLQNKNYSCSLICWGRDSPLLQKIRESDATVFRTFWRWGCRWHIPDWILLLLNMGKIRSSNTIVLGKLFPYSILKVIRFVSSRKSSFIYITPYKPSIPTSEKNRRTYSKTLNLFDLILIQADSFSEVLHKLCYSGAIKVLPYISDKGVNYNVNQFPSLEEGNPLRIGFLGRLVEDKNIFALLEAIQYLIHNYASDLSRKIHLELFGDGHLRGQLESVADDMNIAEYVTFSGHIPNDQVEKVISSCHIFVFTSRTEGQCLAALEILSCGRPIVASDVGAFPAILSDLRFGKIVAQVSPQQISERILEVFHLIEKKVITPESIQSAYLERYELDRIGSQYLEVIDALSTKENGYLTVNFSLEKAK